MTWRRLLLVVVAYLCSAIIVGGWIGIVLWEATRLAGIRL